jgi:hypothetical protein
MRRVLYALTVVAAVLGVLINMGPANAAAIGLCGTLQALTRPNPPGQEGTGTVTIDGKTYQLSSALASNGLNSIAAGVAVGDQVCLTGDVVADTNVVRNYQLISCKGGGAPACTASSLPSTSTDARSNLPVQTGPGVIALVLGLAAIALSGTRWARRRVSKN